jgi:hypothetical protein
LKAKVDEQKKTVATQTRKEYACMRKANLSLESQRAQQPDGQRGLRAQVKKLNAETRDGTKGMLSQHIDRGRQAAAQALRERRLKRAAKTSANAY